MKQFVFKNYLLMAFIGILATSCSKSNDDEVTKADPKLLSFGFYEANNEGVIVQDYEVSAVTGTAITIALPKEIDRSELVAQFTASPNTTVTVNGEIQQSGNSVQDFSTPVDYIVTEGQTNARYTITVVNAADYVWTKLSTYSSDETNNMIMKVNPVDGIPYVLYKGNREESEDEKAFMVKFEDNSWSFVGSDQGVSDGQVGSDLDLAFDKDGKTYAAYLDYTANVSQAVSVKQLQNSAWSLVGSKGFTNEKISYMGMGINPANQQPMVFNTIDGRSGTLPRRALGVSNFDGSTWSINNEIPGRSTSTYASLQVSKTVGDALYLGIFNNGGSPQTYSIYKYENNTWETIAEQMIEPGAGNLNLRDFDLDVDRSGNIYIIAADDATTSGTYNPRVKKYDAETKSWSQVGNVLPFDLGSARYLSLAVSPTGVPFVLYRNEQMYPEVVSLDSETKDWTAPKVLEASQLGVADVYLDFSPDGVGYAAFVNEAGAVSLYKYDVPAK